MVSDILVIVTVKYLVLLMVTVTLKCSVIIMVTVTEVFSVRYGRCHSAPYRRSAVPVLIQPHIKTMQQPVTPAISTQCFTQDPTVNVNCH
jgi:hypothetical protein